MKIILTVCLALVWGGTVRADGLSTAQLQAEQRELGALLAKADLAGADESGGELGRRLSQMEFNRLAKLLGDPEVSRIVTLEQALHAIERRHKNPGPVWFPDNELLDLVNRRWPHEPVVIAFYRRALTAGGDEAIIDLWSPSPGVWDDSLLEPVIRLVEKTSSWITIDISLSALEQHYAVWAKDTNIPRRLSTALLAMFPSMTNAAKPGPRPGDQLWCNAARMLGMTHDPAMVAVLRPFLADKVVAGDGSYWVEKDDPPLRARDKAAMAIAELLGEKDFLDGTIGVPGMPYFKLRQSYPKWEEWDKKIAELQKRMDAGKPARQ